MNEYPPWGDGEAHLDPVEDYKARLLSEVEKLKLAIPSEDAEVEATANELSEAYNRAITDILNLIKEKGE